MTAGPKVHDVPFRGPGAWEGAALADPAGWTWLIPPAVLAEFDAALRRIRAAGRHIPELSAADFPAPSFRPAADAMRAELETGRGFVVLSGLPLDAYTEAEAAILYWGIAVHLGTPIPQNARRDYLFSVRDEGYDFHRQYGAAGVRISRTSSAIEFHTDSSAAYAGYTPDIVSLLAIETARAGGMTALVSAQTVHNILLRERPDCLERLYAPYYFDRRAELLPGQSETIQAPVFSAADGTLSIRYFRFNLMKGHETAGVPLTAADLEAIDVLEQVCRREPLALRFDMRRGDMQFVNNRFILHSRTAFEDHAEPERRRHFLRLWLRYGAGRP